MSAKKTLQETAELTGVVGGGVGGIVDHQVHEFVVTLWMIVPDTLA